MQQPSSKGRRAPHWTLSVALLGLFSTGVNAEQPTTPAMPQSAADTPFASDREAVIWRQDELKDLERLLRQLRFDLVNNQIRPTNREVTCYAESRDGINWVTPELGLFAHGDSKKNNIIWEGAGSHNFSPFIDERPDCPILKDLAGQ